MRAPRGPSGDPMMQPSPAERERRPVLAAGWAGGVREALFPTPVQALVSLALTVLIATVAYAFIDWAIFRAVFAGSDGSACRVPDAGACWPFITHKLNLFLYGRYPESELWRVHLTYSLALAGLAPL